MKNPGSFLPSIAGIALKPEFYAEALERSGSSIWYEVHPENYMVDGGPRLAWLSAFAEKHVLSFHGVGASLGGLDPFDKTHLTALKNLIAHFNPAQVSEHATWSSFDGRYFADLLPLPRTKAAQDHMVARIDEFQTAIGRRILIENPTNYMRVASDMDEPEFLVEIAKRAGCGLLLDVNNVYISSVNVGIDAAQYIQALPTEIIGEIHIAGFDEDKNHGAALLIDTHSAPVSEQVWDLLDVALAHTGPVPVLLERDGNIPALSELLTEQARAQSALDRITIGEGA
ncbi:MAG: DUF692 domain-containing protein [Robiginitomaculum sp.]|nr:DUF692 domain-containing protein [Robiginitomaculum sp.]